MNATAAIEQHFDILDTRASVFSVEIEQRIDIPDEQFDRAVMLDIELGKYERVETQPKRQGK